MATRLTTTTQRIRIQTGEMTETPLTQSEVEQMIQDGEAQTGTIYSQIAAIIRDKAHTMQELRQKTGYSTLQIRNAFRTILEHGQNINTLRVNGQKYYTTLNIEPPNKPQDKEPDKEPEED